MKSGELVNRLDRLLYGVVRAVAAFAVFSMIAVTFLDVLGRHFASAIPGASEIISVQLGIAFFAGMSLVFREKAHIVVGLLVPRYPKRWQRLEQIFSNLVSIAAMALISWLMFDKGQKLAAAHTLSGFLGFELSYMAWCLALLAAIATWFAIRGPKGGENS